ncbi:hypothetical protein M1M25_gp069 [Tenacibaculum phage Gundel_1]|uniref:Uncharacterized protein n=1 Tax=Tenacibaculum phage Gundel_1 TaxID=2745672 RepID=A0A8E4ZM89_9CAUD|nr:hypothetical protein M1M25_gp069 [Tenacibaculum phage Gundel_1]QQV91504.1 hypothetical protein Gundel1_69 [Tenacibaculum phage Gundel_1]
MQTGDLIVTVLCGVIALLIIYALPLIMTDDYDYPSEIRFKYLIRFLDFYLWIVSFLFVVGGTLGVGLIFIIACLVLMPIGLFFDFSFFDSKEMFLINFFGGYYYFVVAYSIFRHSKYCKIR